MADFWVTFKTGPRGCVTAANRDEGLKLAGELTGREPVSLARLPYPAEPRLNRVLTSQYGPCPSFCFSPDQCAGFSSCPRPYACSE